MRKMIGHAHAVGFTLSIPTHRNRVQQCLWQAIQASDDIVSHVPPDPAWAIHSKAIFSYTVRRTRDHIRGCTGDSDFVDGLLVRKKADEDLDEIEQSALTVLNGEWRRPGLVHHCMGCCSTIEEAKGKVFGAVLNCRFLLGSDDDLPNPGRWGSKERGVAGIVGGIMCHSVLQHTVEQAFTTWEQGEPSQEDGGDDADYTLLCKKKVWRMRKVDPSANKILQETHMITGNTYD